MNKLTVGQLILLNRRLTGKPLDTREVSEEEALKNILDEVVYKKNTANFYNYKDTVEKAAKLGCLIVSKKPFKEKNSATAIFAVLTLLNINGYKMQDYANDLGLLKYWFEDQNYDKACEWIKEHCEEKRAFEAD